AAPSPCSPSRSPFYVVGRPRRFGAYGIVPSTASATDDNRQGAASTPDSGASPARFASTWRIASICRPAASWRNSFWQNDAVLRARYPSAREIGVRGVAQLSPTTYGRRTSPYHRRYFVTR